METASPIHTLCIGAGPAGLTAAYLLAKAGKKVLVLEQDNEYVGGIARTVKYKGFHFDIGGHRFFTKSAEVEALWDEILGPAFVERPRKSRIFYGGKFYPYPLEPLPTLRNLGIGESIACVLSYVKARFRPRKPVVSFEDWIINRFGERLYRTFFKTYTEKVWGMECSAISADWAAQRIKGLSLSSAIWHALRPKRAPGADRSKVIKTLIHTFRYPALGPGQMWEACRDKIQDLGSQVKMGARVEAVRFIPENHCWQVEYASADGARHTVEAEHIISSMPLRNLVECIEPKLPQAALHAASQLGYRDFLIVALIVNETHAFDDNWLYIHEPDVKVGRIQNFKSWSPAMVPDPILNCYGMEYFCFAGDGLWTSSDKELIMLASKELQALGLAMPEDIIDGCVIRQPKAYPVYDQHYQAHVETIRQALAACPNLHVAGRAGMHKYNNQDHAMMTAMLTVENILSGTAKYDVWQVNQDAEYHEHASTGENAASGLRAVPKPLS